MNKDEAIKDLCSLEIKDKRLVWEPFMKKYNCQIICEVGVRKGYNFQRMIAHQPAKAVAVDIWRNDGVIARNDIGYDQQELDKEYSDLVEYAKDNPFINIYREYSIDAAKHFPNEYFDLIYIDADHTYEGCYHDIANWWPKVKKQGFLVGDDYRRHKTRTGVKFGVIKAVKTFAKRHNLQFHPIAKKCWAIIKI